MTVNVRLLLTINFVLGKKTRQEDQKHIFGLI